MIKKMPFIPTLLASLVVMAVTGLAYPSEGLAAVKKPQALGRDFVSPDAPSEVTMPNGDIYYKPNLKQLLNMLIRLGAYDYKDDTLIDEYVMINDCAVYKGFYQNDFRWHEVKKAMRAEIEAKMKNLPMSIYFDVGMRLKRYDFDTKLFRLERKGSGDGVNTFTVDASGEGFCWGSKIVYTPLVYKTVLQHIIRIDGIPLTSEEAEALARRMDLAGNSGRMVYVRFKIKGIYAEKLNFIVEQGKKRDSNGTKKFTQGRLPQGTVRIDANLDYIEFYEDEARTRLIKTIKP